MDLTYSYVLFNSITLSVLARQSGDGNKEHSEDLKIGLFLLYLGSMIISTYTAQAGDVRNS